MNYEEEMEEGFRMGDEPLDVPEEEENDFNSDDPEDRYH